MPVAVAEQEIVIERANPILQPNFHSAVSYGLWEGGRYRPTIKIRIRLIELQQFVADRRDPTVRAVGR
jgi:hypothetical protein